MRPSLIVVHSLGLEERYWTEFDSSPCPGRKRKHPNGTMGVKIPTRKVRRGAEEAPLQQGHDDNDGSDSGYDANSAENKEEEEER